MSACPATEAKSAKDFSEADVRAMRDAIYGDESKYATDAGWEACKKNWLKPENIEWLRQQPQNRRAA